jgi:hypothetical protein
LTFYLGENQGICATEYSLFSFFFFPFRVFLHLCEITHKKKTLMCTYLSNFNNISKFVRSRNWWILSQKKRKFSWNYTQKNFTRVQKFAEKIKTTNWVFSQR